MDDLSPCPFCGSSDVYVSVHKDRGAYVNCEECAAEGPQAVSGNQLEAVEKWERRAGGGPSQIAPWHRRDDVVGMWMVQGCLNPPGLGYGPMTGFASIGRVLGRTPDNALVCRRDLFFSTGLNFVPDGTVEIVASTDDGCFSDSREEADGIFQTVVRKMWPT